MTIYNLEYRILDKLDRTKKIFHGGVYLDESKVQQAKEEILKSVKDKKVAFDVYVIEQKSPIVY